MPAACPGCGLAYAEFKAKGRLGCPRCYAAFGPVLIPLLEIHQQEDGSIKIPKALRPYMNGLEVLSPK